MSFMVNFRSAEGKQGYHPADTLEEAVRFVEHLRNQEQVADARVWRLHEVPLEVKTYYKVELAPAGPEPAAAARPSAVDEPRPEPVAVSAGAESAGAADPNGANGANGARFARFNRT